MTNQEAISNLKKARCVPYKKETLTMAIKALEQEPCEEEEEAEEESEE